MKKITLWTLIACLSAFAISAQAAEKMNSGKKAAAAKKTDATAIAAPEGAKAPAGDRSLLKTDEDKMSYAVGYFQIGLPLKNEAKINKAAFMQALQDALADKAPAVTQEEAREVGMKMKAEGDKKAAELGKKGEAFLEENKKKEGVKVTASGLQYKIIKAGTGPTAKDGEEVEVKYRGTLVDGTEFDNSAKRPEPTKFTVGEVVPGWNEALKMMNKGSNWQLFIPSKLGYAERGAGEKIGPNATLIFDLELVDIKPGQTAAMQGLPSDVTARPVTRGAKQP